MFRRIICALLVTSLAGFGGQFQQSYPPADQPQQYPSPQYPQSQYPEQQQLPPVQQGDPNAPQGQAGNPADDMQHGVARLSMVQGDVNVRRGDNGQLTIAVANAPLMGRDHLETAAGSRAEVQLDANTIVRLGPNTDAGFATLQYRKAQIQIGLGTVIYRVLGNSETQVEMDTPSVGIRALGPGDYRISVFDNGTSQITVRSGQLELMAPRGTERVNAGQSVMVRGDAADPEMQTSSEAARDQFDDWSDQRDREIAPQQSAQYASPDIQGTGDLDRNGNWVPSGYGQVWHPQEVGPDWSPYSDGQWSYSDYYGWTWVDSAPWGWAPYHYGRWFWNTGYGWCWWPGARGGFNYWSPAMVGFFGWGRPGIGVGVGFGFAGLGWVALAPFEVFHPWWGRGGVGFRGGYALASFRNSAIRGGALTASYNGFGGVRQRFAAATRSQLTGASTFGGRVPVTPSAASYRFSARTPVANPRLAAAQNRSFYRSNTSAISRPSYSSNSRAQSSSAGWQRFGSPSATGSVRQNYSQGAESGWHSFGQPQSSSRSAYSEPRQSYSAPRQSYSAPRQSYSAPASQPRYSAPSNQQRYSAPAAQPRYSAPAQPRYSAPAQQRSAPAPHYSAPKSSGGGGSHPSGGGHASGGGGRHGR